MCKRAESLCIFVFLPGGERSKRFALSALLCKWLEDDVLSAHRTLVILTVQDFPYNYEEGVEHHVLWSTQPLERDEIEEVREDSLLPLLVLERKESWIDR